MLLIFGQCALLLDAAGHATSVVERVAHPGADGEVGEGWRLRQRTQELRAVLLPADAGVGAHLRPQCAAACRQQLLRFIERGASRDQRAVASQRPLHDLIQLWRVEHPPPLRIDRCIWQQVLCNDRGCIIANGSRYAAGVAL
ncbi:MAG: hypothetical protein WDO12_13765 [Pseudomonadota bacterium]